MPKLLHGTVEKNKLKIERAALYLFTRRGFHGTTVREIAKKAGISMGKLYIYYDTKEDIFIDLSNHLARNMEAIRQKELIPLMASLDPDSLRKLAKAIGRVVSENLDYWRLMYIDVVEFRHKHFIHSFREIAGGLRTYANAVIRGSRVAFPARSRSFACLHDDLLAFFHLLPDRGTFRGETALRHERRRGHRSTRTSLYRRARGLAPANLVLKLVARTCGWICD